MNRLAPIVLFTYKRLDTLKQTISALQENDFATSSELFIFSDAAKIERDVELIQAVRSYLKTVSGFKRTTIFEAETNKGLANSIISGVSQIIAEYEKVIVLEDDLKTTPNFLAFMNSCLNHFEKEQAVFSISGYAFDFGPLKDYEHDIYFLNRGWSWGWATWKDRWESVDWAAKAYTSFQKDKQAKRAFSQGGSDLNSMLRKQMEGKLDSWAIRWFFHQYQVNGLTVYPVSSKVSNHGFDENATHTKTASKRYVPVIDKSCKTKFAFPEKTEVTSAYQRKFQRRMGISARIKSKLEGFFKLR
jgi:hypothetical protein